MAVDRQVSFMELDWVSLFWLCVSGFQFREHRACFKPRPPVYLLPPVPKENPRHDFKKSEKVLQACRRRWERGRLKPGMITAESTENAEVQGVTLGSRFT